MLNERNQMQRTRHCMILSLWNEQSRQTDKHTEQISDYLGLELRAGIAYKWAWDLFFWGWKCLKTGLSREYAEVSTVNTCHWIVHLEQVFFIICNLYLIYIITKQNKTYHFLKKKVIPFVNLFIPLLFPFSQKDKQFI